MEKVFICVKQIPFSNFFIGRDHLLTLFVELRHLWNIFSISEHNQMKVKKMKLDTIVPVFRDQTLKVFVEQESHNLIL